MLKLPYSIPTVLLGLTTAIALGGSQTVLAAWNYVTLQQVEQELNQFLKTLPKGETLESPRVFVYQGVAMTPCGQINTPAYCPGDNTVYLETKLLDRANQALGDYAAYVVLAHEYGHSYLSQTDQQPQGKLGELKADEFAGAFTRYAQEQNLLENGDIEEALKFSFASGDYDYWDKGHHGTPTERANAFKLGLTGNSSTFALKGRNPEPSGDRSPSNETESPTIQTEEPVPRSRRTFSKGLLLLPLVLLILPAIGFGLYYFLKEEE